MSAIIYNSIFIVIESPLFSNNGSMIILSFSELSLAFIVDGLAFVNSVLRTPTFGLKDIVTGSSKSSDFIGSFPLFKNLIIKREISSIVLFSYKTLIFP
ncbi:MAG: hypothetical protein ACYDHX_12880 [Methanothrix sp.]